MTANAFEDDVRQTREAGMDAHLRKPIQTELFYSTLEALLKVDYRLQRPKILLVDDVALNRAVLRVTLEKDYDVLESEDGLRALEILERDREIDVVITDIHMPEMDGIQLIQTIRANHTYKNLVIIANTQYGDPKQEEELISIGADEFVYRPSSPKMISIRVRNALKRQ